MPLALYALTAGAFGIGVTEFVIMGLLLDVGATLHVSIASAGLLIATALVALRVDRSAAQRSPSAAI